MGVMTTETLGGKNQQLKCRECGMPARGPMLGQGGKGLCCLTGTDRELLFDLVKSYPAPTRAEIDRAMGIVRRGKQTVRSALRREPYVSEVIGDVYEARQPEESVEPSTLNAPIDGDGRPITAEYRHMEIALPPDVNGLTNKGGR